ncbi:MULTISPECIES: hypothetical protein [Veillonella]|uniref:Uncharacterized protein n=1 Tax=Veillonella tobetsuensis TaxID=1110546 RepID=A0A2S7ZRR3_9FIRM|nr:MULTISPECIES: hypothetical protein [Veillonella]MDU5085269.1 hypothetical protein [Veillonella sp.]PQL25956.1 hypothetical protein VTHSUH11_00970 [Veillonella tobetsuensis]
MDTHARTAKWSKGIPEMDVLSLAEQEMVCNKVAKQLFAICVTVVTLILIAIIAGMFESPWLLDYMTDTANTINQNLSTAHSQAGRAGGTMASLPRMIPVLAAMLIPTMVVFYIIKKPLLKRETRKLVEKKLADTPSTYDVLTSVYWAFSNQEYVSNDAFTLDIINYIEDNKANWNPKGIAINSRKVCIVYEAFITGSEQVRSNEHIVDITDLDEENRIDGVFQTDIKAYLTADNGKYFTNVELLRKIHNQLAYKDLGNNESFEGLEYVDTDGGTLVYRLMTGS